MARIHEIRIELGTVASSPELHTLLMKSLDFPGWYGRNWNAFWDAITALVEMPEQLVLGGWQEFSLRMPGEAQLMRKCLEDMSKQYPGLSSRVVYA
jgi:RNAse (barnase) inhibitor barstar